MSLWYLADMSETDVHFAGVLQMQPTGLEPCRRGQDALNCKCNSKKRALFLWSKKMLTVSDCL